ncbi:oligosaccharide flippase family protein [Iocasia frigidifontis]|uniref:Oligosaccharide flippase family protein n=1 Tax=Iocasia fonsfrigidae TaxID=2682810 RepID=A0A8A7KLM1_9FIRM|nr:oligosaccharide flippase family protein [Iocasia fonsfrigidae]QTL99727.1 oligosaccharide flippase family protein [Iocasia fonsfrigidae]
MQNKKIIKDQIKKVIGRENLEFVNHAKNYMSAEFFTKALSFISVPIFTRLLTPDEYGILAIFSSIISIFTVILSLRIAGANARYYYENNNKFNDFLGTNLIFIVIFNIISLYLMYIYRTGIAEYFNIKVDVFIIAVIVASLNVPIGIYLSYLQFSKQSKKYSEISVIKSIIILLLSISLVYLLKENRYYGKIYSLLTVTVVFSSFTIYKSINIAHFKFKIKYIKYALVFGIPLIPHSLSRFILNFFDRIIINQVTGPNDAGLYSFAYNVGMVMNVVVMATTKAWTPIFYEYMKKGSFDKIKKLSYEYSNYIYYAAIILILFSKEIVIILADKSYHIALNLVPIIIISYIFMFYYILYSGYSFYRKKTALISLATLLSGVINIILNYWLIPQFGYIAAAYTTAFSYLVLFTFHFINVKFVLKEKELILFRKIVINFVWVVISVIALYFINIYLSGLIIPVVVKLVIIVLTGWKFFVN